MPRLACIIPALSNTESLETTLVSVLERRPDDCEVLVVLNTPYTDPYNLQGEVRFLQVSARADLISCLNHGIAATNSPIVHLLASGWQADDNWIEQALPHFDNPRVAAVTPAIYSANNELLATGVGYHRGGRKTICRTLESTARSSLDAIGPFLQAAFYRKSALNTIGGLPAGLGEQLADVDLALSLRYAGWQIETDSKCRVIAPAIDGPQAGGLLQGMYAERLFWRHVAEVGGIVGLLSHPVGILREIANVSPRWKIPSHILGRLVALFQPRYYRAYRHELVAAKVEAAAAKSAWEALQASGTNDPDRSHQKQQTRIDTAHKATGPAEILSRNASRRQKSR